MSQGIKTSFFTVLFIFAGLFVYLNITGSIPFSISSIQTNKINLFSVDGTGKAVQAPNIVNLTVGVTKTAPTILQAQEQANSIMDKLIADLKKNGIENKNIKTTNYNIFPDYDYSSPRQNIIGYTVSQNIEIKIKPVDKANKIIDITAADGANIVGQLFFTFDDETKKKLEDKARQEAVKNAKHKAKLMADAAGIRLGKIIDIKESTGVSEPIRILSNGLGGGEVLDKQSTQLPSGENTILINITLYYETK